MMTSVTRLKRSGPEAEGISSSAVLEFIRAVEQHTHPLDAVQGFMLLRHGNVASEGWWTPYGPQSPHSLYSLSKSFTATAIGLAVQEGLLTVDDPVLKFFPDDAPANPSENLKAMRVRHLLSMNTGHQEDTTADVFGDLNQVSLFGCLQVVGGYVDAPLRAQGHCALHVGDCAVNLISGKQILLEEGLEQDSAHLARAQYGDAHMGQLRRNFGGLYGYL